jgi:hypothetical protein
MIHFIRDLKNRTIVDIETTKNDIHVKVDIRFYTLHLFTLCDPNTLDFMDDTDDLDNLASEWFESKPDFRSIDDFVRSVCKSFTNKWNLCYVED